jgi:hypothetical protein
MSRTCFWGCGRSIPRFPLGSRSASTRGRLIAERLVWFADVAPGLAISDDNLGNWFDGGERLLVEIRDMLHGDLDPGFAIHERARTG